MSWVSGAFALGGVIVGALVSGGVSLFLEQRRENNAIAVAKRLVLDELHSIWSHLVMLDDEQKTPQALPADQAARFLPTRDWTAYREALANPRAFSDDIWIALSAFMSSVESQRLIILSLPPLSPVPDQAGVKPALALAADLYRTVSGRSSATVRDP